MGTTQGQQFIPQQNNFNSKQGRYLTKQQIIAYQKQSNQTKKQLKQCKQQNQKLNKRNTQLQQKSNNLQNQNKQLQKIIQFIYKGQQHIHSQNQQIYKQKQQLYKQKQQQNKQLKTKLTQTLNLLEQYKNKQNIKLLQQKHKNQQIQKTKKINQLLQQQNRFQTQQSSQRQYLQSPQSEICQTRSQCSQINNNKTIKLDKTNLHHNLISSNSKLSSTNKKQKSSQRDNLSQDLSNQSKVNHLDQNSNQNSQILKNDHFHIHSLLNSMGKIYKIKKSESNQDSKFTWASGYITHKNKLITIAGFFLQQGKKDQLISMDEYEIRFYPYLLQTNPPETKYIKVKGYKVLQQFKNSQKLKLNQKIFDISSVQLQQNNIIKQQHCLKLFSQIIPDLFNLYVVCYVPIEQIIQKNKRQFQQYKGMQLKVLGTQIKQIQVNNNNVMKEIKEQDLNKYLYDGNSSIVFNFGIKSKNYKKIKYIKGTPLLIKYKQQYYFIGMNVLPKVNEKNISIIINNHIINQLLN